MLTIPLSLLVEGAVAGSWRVQTKGKRLIITLQPFSTLSQRVADQLEAEAGHSPHSVAVSPAR